MIRIPNMTAQAYCQQKAAPPGSAFYYSVALLPAAVRAAIIALAAFYQELDDIVYECQDAALAQVKFGWWRNEILTLHEGRCDHPVLKELSNITKTFAITPQQYLDLVAGLEQNLNVTPFQTFEDVTVHIIHTMGLRERLIAQIQGCEWELVEEEIYSLTIVLNLVEHLQYLRRDKQRGLIYIPDDELQQFHITTASWAATTTPEMKNLLAHQYEKIQRAHQFAVRHNVAALQKCSSLHIRVAIALVTLEEIRLSGFDVLKNFTRLTPLRNWWLARKVRANLTK